jgi:hypothetical protein
MATIGTGTNYAVDGAPNDLRLTPETYTTLADLVKTTKDFVMPDLVETYGDQGITGFLQLTGAVNSGGTADRVDWWEAGRRHRTISVNSSGTSASNNVLTINFDTDTDGVAVGPNDVIMDTADGKRYIVEDVNASTPAGATVILAETLDREAAVDNYSAAASDAFIVIGNLYGQGTEQPGHFTEPDAVKRSNPFMIVKDRFQVNGSQATNIGWVNVGGGEYRWFMYGEQEARKRFEDRREMMLLFGQQRDGSTGTDGMGAGSAYDYESNQDAGLGSDGYISTIEDRGIVITNAFGNPMDSFAEFDDLILELDKQGAPAEYAMYLNRKQDLAIDDMLASGIATSVTAGLPGQFGAFNNDADMAVKLGFKSFTRGGYTFHKHDWKLLNDPTLLGASNFLQGAMVPLANVTDPRTGGSAPSLAMYYKEANGYSREMEHWITGGGVLGHSNNGDAGRDVATFHYRSEINLCVRAANKHVIIKGL